MIVFLSETDQIAAQIIGEKINAIAFGPDDPSMLSLQQLGEAVIFALHEKGYVVLPRGEDWDDEE